MTLVLATSSAALSMNVFLPSLPGIARHFDADYAVVQLTVSLYLAATAVLQLGIGPASDRFGRRPVMLTCFVVFILGSIACIYAPTIEFLLGARLLQSFSAAGMVLSRAIVRDTVSADEAASRIGYVTMGMAMVPMIAPAIGGYLDEIYGWQAAFILTLVFSAVALLIIFLDLGETNFNRSSSMTEQVKGYPELLRARRFWGYALTAGFTSGTFFAFVGGGPYVASQVLNLSPSQYGIYFGLLSLGYVGGNFLSGRYSRSVGLNRMMLVGAAITIVGMAVALVLVGAGVIHPLAIFGPTALVGVGNGMALPNANAGLVSVRPHLAGSASGLGGSMQIGLGAVLAAMAGAMLSPETGAAPLLWMMMATSVASLLATLYVIRVARQSGEL